MLSCHWAGRIAVAKLSVLKLGRGGGTVVATEKDPRVDGLKLYVVRDLSPQIEEETAFVVAVDAVGAGVGEVVLYASGSAARQTTQTADRPVDAVVMAIVDEVNLGGKRTYCKADGA